MAYNAIGNPGTRWAVIAPTFGDARDTCVEGESGLKAVLDRYRMVRRWNRSHGELDLLNGSKIKCFSADEPERLRGPQHHGAWCDELAAWRYEDAWDQLKFGLRLGENPQTLVTTTPKPNKLTKRVLGNPSTIVTRGSTFDNAANLSPAALEEFRLRYEGTRLGRQELYGELLEDVEGALWSLKLIEQNRVPTAPQLTRVVVAVDPAVTYGPDSDETGIVTVGITGDQMYVLNDSTLKASPDEWAKAVIQEYHRAQADHVVIETNQGGDMALSVLRTVDPTVPVKKVTASRGKQLRAEPVAALYEQGKVHHVGVLDKLEEQMTSWTPDDKTSPDRLDALVWACTALMTRHVPQVQTFAT